MRPILIVLVLTLMAGCGFAARGIEGLEIPPSDPELSRRCPRPGEVVDAVSGTVADDEIAIRALGNALIDCGERLDALAQREARKWAALAVM